VDVAVRTAGSLQSAERRVATSHNPHSAAVRTRNYNGAFTSPKTC